MNRERLLNISDAWFTLLLRFYPPDFRDDMGKALVETYRDRAREALNRGGLLQLMGVWMSALRDSLRSGPGERAYPAVSWRRGGNWGRDLEIAMRRLRRSPALVLAMVGTLTVGLGAFAVVYTAVQKIVLDRMPYKNPDDLYFVWRDYRAFFDLDRGWLAGTDVAELQKAGGVIEQAVGLQRGTPILSGANGAESTQIAVLTTSPGLFEMLGVAPAIGRGFAPHEVGAGRTPLIVLTHDLWTRLGAKPEILGTELRLNGQPFTVIGVMPKTFAFQLHSSLGRPQGVNAFVTFGLNLAETRPSAGSYAGLIRARHGSAPATVASAVSAVARIVDTRDFNSRGMKLYPTGLKSDLIVAVRPALYVIGCAGVFLLLVLMVNMASVLLARASEREHEFAVSRALGASGTRIVRATLLEGGLLGLMGGITGTIVAIWGTGALVALAPLDLPRRETVAVTWDIALVVIGAGLVLGLLAATAPATWAIRSSLSSLLSRSAVRGGGGHGRLRRAMVVAQVALSLVLLTAGGLVVRSFDRLLQADPGFRTDGLLTLRVPLPAQFGTDPQDAIAIQDRIVESLKGVPGVTAVSATSVLPLSAGASQNTLRVPGAPGNTGNAERDAPLVDYYGARAGYIETMGIRMREGRPFEATRVENVREALIDVQVAQQFFPGVSPLGQKFPWGGTNNTATIVGVFEQPRLYDVHQDGRPMVIERVEDAGYRTLFYVMRTNRDPAQLVTEARAAIRGVNPQLAVSEVRPMNEIVANSLRQQRTSAVLIAGFAIGALLLTALGLYGVVSGSVTRRRHEIAVRLALGADHNRVLRLILIDSVVIVALGLLIGAPGVYGSGGLIRGILVGVSPWDPITLVAVSTGLAVIAMAACFVPACRVLRIAPAQSLLQ
jgi:putative ABC transport system permease protein